jgi:serine/threonine protein kinase
MSLNKIVEKSNISLNGVRLEGRILVIDLIKDSQDLDPHADLHVAPLVGAGKLASLSDLKKGNKIALLRRIWRSVCLAMHYIHDLGYAHGLLTPDKIVWDFEKEQIFISGWNSVGVEPDPKEFPFCPPELLGDKKISGATDIYFLAALLFFIETGETVHQGDKEESLKDSVQSNIIHPILNTEDTENSDNICRVVSKGLKTAPSDRYSTVVELLEASESVLKSPSSRELWPTVSTALTTYLAIVGVFLWFLVWIFSF